MHLVDLEKQHVLRIMGYRAAKVTPCHYMPRARQFTITLLFHICRKVLFHLVFCIVQSFQHVVHYCRNLLLRQGCSMYFYLSKYIMLLTTIVYSYVKRTIYLTERLLLVAACFSESAILTVILIFAHSMHFLSFLFLSFFHHELAIDIIQHRVSISLESFLSVSLSLYLKTREFD